MARLVHCSESRFGWHKSPQDISDLTGDEEAKLGLTQPPAQKECATGTIATEDEEDALPMYVLDDNENVEENDDDYGMYDIYDNDDDEDGDYKDDFEGQDIDDYAYNLAADADSRANTEDAAPDSEFDRGLLYSKPLLAAPHDQGIRHINQKRGQVPPKVVPDYQGPMKAREEDSTNIHATVNNPRPVEEGEGQVSAFATAEPGGACIDSFANFAIRLREQCTMSCVKTIAHIFAKPDIGGLLGCYNCINFFIRGISALVTDCTGIFAPNAMSMSTASSFADSLLTEPAKGMDSNESFKISPSGEAADKGLGTLDFADVIHSLQNVDMNEVQEWLDVGRRISESSDVTKHTATDNRAVAGESKLEQQEGDQGKISMNRDLFNMFVIKAASLISWKLTPDMLDATGVYERIHAAGIV
ncbi:hypothetical protein BGX28_003047 [Mortierella sp. GBA30]|nr:hypothetical protein BGX28_003047 [Mortierella sp. GBA30]